MKINIDYKRKPEEEQNVSDSQLTQNYIEYAVGYKYRNTPGQDGGLSGSERRMFGRIQRKLDAAIEEGKDEVIFELSELDFIKNSFRDAKFPPAAAKCVVMLEDELEKKEEKDEAKQ